MNIHLAPQTIEALAYVISGGHGNDPTPAIGIYRSGPKLESFMRGCNVSMHVGSGSRVPTLIAALESASVQGNQKILRTIVERAADPRGFLDAPEKLTVVIDYMNARLIHDGFELRDLLNFSFLAMEHPFCGHEARKISQIARPNVEICRLDL
jgi:hypothetical protein